jgi:dTDP-4-dehydrorhamnose reductase
VDHSKVIFTGESGLLGTAFKKIMPDLTYPTLEEFDILQYKQMEEYANAHEFEQLVHAAAFTSPPQIEKYPMTAMDVNIVGTANIVKLCAKFNARLIYICTDYVFKGDKGNYKEDDPVHPINKYGWSKLGGECAVRLYDKSLVIRTTFGPDVFPYEKAFVDQWTSRENVSIIAGKIGKLVDMEVLGVVHVCGERKTVFEYAKNLDESRDIGELSVDDVNFDIPFDTSLNCDKYDGLIGT